VDDVDATLAAMGADAVVTLGPLDFGAFIPGWRTAWVSDPDGNIVEISQGYTDQDDPPSIVRPHMNELRFTFSDLIAGYVTSFDEGTRRFVMKTSDGREFAVDLTDTMSAELVRNLEEPYADASGLVNQMLVPGRFLFAYGVFYPQGGGHVFEAKRLVFVGRKEISSSSRSRTGGSSRSPRSATPI
jgi:hypothetical protein